MADAAPMACRGCAAVAGPTPGSSPERVGLADSPKTPPISLGIQDSQSTDGFPALRVTPGSTAV